MKKLFVCVLSLVTLLSITITCYAGDIPETLLGVDSCQVYFGEVKNIDGDTITVIQKQNIKGDFCENREYTYPEFTFTDSPVIGEVYLCGYFDENNPLYIWEVTSLEIEDLEIINTDDMSKRMQEYLNEGQFEKKENERLLRTELNSDIESSSEPTNSTDIDATNQTDTANQNNNSAPANTNMLFIIIFAAIIFVGIVLIIWKNRVK